MPVDEPGLAIHVRGFRAAKQSALDAGQKSQNGFVEATRGFHVRHVSHACQLDLARPGHAVPYFICHELKVAEVSLADHNQGWDLDLFEALGRRRVKRDAGVTVHPVPSRIIRHDVLEASTGTGLLPDRLK